MVLGPGGGVGGIMVSIAAFQAVDPGSIPGRRRYFFFTAKLVIPLDMDTISYDGHVGATQVDEITL